MARHEEPARSRGFDPGCTAQEPTPPWFNGRRPSPTQQDDPRVICGRYFRTGVVYLAEVDGGLVAVTAGDDGRHPPYALSIDVEAILAAAAVDAWGPGAVQPSWVAAGARAVNASTGATATIESITSGTVFLAGYPAREWPMSTFLRNWMSAT